MKRRLFKLVVFLLLGMMMQATTTLIEINRTYRLGGRTAQTLTQRR